MEADAGGREKSRPYQIGYQIVTQHAASLRPCRMWLAKEREGEGQENKENKEGRWRPPGRGEGARCEAPHAVGVRG